MRERSLTGTQPRQLLASGIQRGRSWRKGGLLLLLRILESPVRVMVANQMSDVHVGSLTLRIGLWLGCRSSRCKVREGCSPLHGMVTKSSSTGGRQSDVLLSCTYLATGYRLSSEAVAGFGIVEGNGCYPYGVRNAGITSWLKDELSSGDSMTV